MCTVQIHIMKMSTIYFKFHERKDNKCKRSVIPIFGEVEPRILHEFTYVTVNVCPLGLLRHDASYVTKCVIVERISNEIVHVTSMRHSCNYNFTE